MPGPNANKSSNKSSGSNAANKESNNSKQATKTVSTPAGPKQVAAKSPAAKVTPSPAAKVVSSSPKPSAPAKAAVDKGKSTPTPAPKPKATPAPTPKVVSGPAKKTGVMVTPASAAELKSNTLKTVSTPAGPKKVSAFPSFAVAGSSPTYKAGDQGRIKAGTPVTPSMVKAGMTKAPVGSPLSATDALRANQMAVKFGANPPKTVSTPAGPKVVDPMKSSFAKGPTTSGRGAPARGASITSEEVLAGIGRPLFGPEATAGYTGKMYPAGGPLRIRVSPAAAEPPPVNVSLYSPAQFAALSPKKPAPPAPPSASAGAPAGGGGGSSRGGGGLAALPGVAGGRVMANLLSNAPTSGSRGTDARVATSMAPSTSGTMAGGGGSPAQSTAGAVGTGGGSATGAGSGGGQGSGGGVGGGIGGIGAGAGAGAGAGVGSGAGAGEGTGLGTGTGAGAGAGAGAGTGTGGGTTGGGTTPPIPPGPSGCPPGYYLYTRPDGTTVCVPDTSGLPMVRPVVAPYYQPYGVASLEGYVPYGADQR